MVEKIRAERIKNSLSIIILKKMVHGLTVQEKKRYLFFTLCGLFLLLSYFMLKPFFSAILTGALLSYLLFPAYLFFQRYIKNKAFAAILLIIGIFLLILVPSLFLFDRLAKETVLFYAYGKEALATGIPCMGEATFSCRIIETINKIINDPFVAHYVGILIQQTSIVIVKAASDVALQSLSYLFDVAIILFVTYYAFLEGTVWATSILNLLPFRDEAKESIVHQLSSISYAIVMGFFMVALTEGLLGFLAFSLVGIKPALFWGVIIAFTALVPFISATVIWLPALIYEISMGYLGAAGVLLFFGILLFLVDNFMRSYLVGSRAQVHPLLIFIGLLGGVQLLGLGGLILGPFILSFSVLLLKIYLAEKT